MFKSPVFEGGLKVLIPVLAIALLFAAGLAAGSLFFNRDGRGTSAEMGELAEGEETTPGAAPGFDPSADERGEAPAEGPVGRSALPPGAEDFEIPDEVWDDPGAGPSDVSEAVKTPDPARIPKPEAPAQKGFLNDNFGSAAAPSRVGGFPRVGSPSMDGDVLEAEYRGVDDKGFDLLFLTVKRTADNKAAREAADHLLHMFPDYALGYKWGGRDIRQAMSHETRPQQFPPLVCMVWTEGRHAVRVVVAPLGPGAVEQARDAVLAFIADLPY